MDNLLAITIGAILLGAWTIDSDTVWVSSTGAVLLTAGIGSLLGQLSAYLW